MQWDAPAGVFERWQPELDRIAPRTGDGHSHLRLMWEPGEPWAPIQRWMIWEMSPAYRAPLGIYEDLKGPNPRWFGHWDPVLDRFVRTRQFTVNQRQWLTYRETGFYGRPIWVCQGKVGGHLRRWSEVQSNLSMTHGGPKEPPEPGALCYAEPDARTITRLADMDLVRKYGDILKVLGSDSQVNERLDSREKEIARMMAEQVWGWLGEQAGEAMEFTRDQLFQIWESGSRDIPEPDMDEGKEEFVESLAGATRF